MRGRARGAAHSVNGQCFETVRGETFFPIADTAWLLVRMSESDIAHYVHAKRAGIQYDQVRSGIGGSRLSKLDFILDTLATYGMYAELFILLRLPRRRAGVGQLRVGRRIAAAFRERPNIFAYTIEGLDSPHAKRDPADMRSALSKRSVA